MSQIHMYLPFVKRIVLIITLKVYETKKPFLNVKFVLQMLSKVFFWPDETITIGI